MTTELRNRTRYDIRRDILALMKEGTVKRTYVMYGARLSYTQLTKYLTDLLDEGFAVETENGITITAAGRKMLGQLEALA